MRVVVTGAAGFIGSHVVDVFLAKGHTVFGIDDHNMYGGAALRNYEHHSGNSSFGMYEANIVSRDQMLNVGRKIMYADLVVHLAARNIALSSFHDRDKYIDANVKGTYNVCSLATETKAKRLLNISSSSVYGEGGVHTTPYAVTKDAAEKIVLQSLPGYMSQMSLRLFNVFGPRQKFWGLNLAFVPAMVRAGIVGNEFQVYGDGEQSRCFTYVKTVAEEIYKKAINNQSGAVDLANNTPRTLNSMIDSFSKHFENGLKVNHVTVRPGDARDSESKGHVDAYPFDLSVKETVDWYRPLVRKL